GGPSMDGLVPHSRNPWSTDRYAGGSSSGAGVALAARMVPLTLGSDTGGSIRIPAAFCGVAGHKPTYGRVSLRGLFPLSGSLDHAGPLAVCSADCAMLLDAISGHDSEDPTSVKAEPTQAYATLNESLTGLRIGYVTNFTENAFVSESMQKSTAKALDVLRELGATVVPVELPDLWDFTTCNTTIMLSEAYAVHEKNLQTNASVYTKFTRSRISLGSMISASGYLNAQKLRRLLNDTLQQRFAEVDVMVYAGMLDDPPEVTKIDPFYFLQTPLITAPANVGGIPTTSVCSGFSELGLPQSIQISGRWFEDDIVLRVAHAYETSVGLSDQLPPNLEDE
ncbi:MAG: aspartyl-tRNA(Asn)/glutamyl-tRNA(Gln) amidotransferase subunit A, partial [Porticoccaceae bacterium]